MAIRGKKLDFDGILINEMQTEVYSDNYYVGMVKNQKALRGDRMKFEMNPAFAKTREESQRVIPLKPLEDCVIQYPKGSISKHFPVYRLLPDSYRNLPYAIKSEAPVTADDANGGGQTPIAPSVGAVMQKLHYQPMGEIEIYKEIAEMKPELLQEMKNLVMRSQLDQEKREQFTQLVDSVMGSVNRNRRSKGSQG